MACKKNNGFGDDNVLSTLFAYWLRLNISGVYVILKFFWFRLNNNSEGIKILLLVGFVLVFEIMVKIHPTQKAPYLLQFKRKGRNPIAF